MAEQLMRWVDGVQKFEIDNSFEYFNMVIDRNTTHHQLSTTNYLPPTTQHQQFNAMTMGYALHINY
ncbi:hypothetical protein [Alteromonas sp. BMJM2]|uniref:hypothetical protein n=1 Tax=Alteromonas sp. BMJM2 TaxID=2954241 RepID=UPI0022B44779|nr:hypothetical protein [Alteromonas sp. BMJM2]